MRIFSLVAGLCGGLALFFFAIRRIDGAFSSPVPGRIPLPATRASSFRFGVGFSALVQSSSAATCATVALADNDLLSPVFCRYAVLGANVGATLTGVLLTVRFSLLAPFVALLGSILLLYSKNENLSRLGSFLSGIGLLFMGSSCMSEAVRPFAETAFLSRLAACDPLVCVLFGTVITAILQSSAATLGILQTLVTSGSFPLQNALFCVFGLNVGTCATALIASLSASRRGRAVALFHLAFNGIGTILLFPCAAIFSRLPFIRALAPATCLAAFHIFFNVSAAALFLLFGEMARLRRSCRRKKKRTGELPPFKALES